MADEQLINSSQIEFVQEIEVINDVFNTPNEQIQIELDQRENISDNNKRTRNMLTPSPVSSNDVFKTPTSSKSQIKKRKIFKNNLKDNEIVEESEEERNTEERDSLDLTQKDHAIVESLNITNISDENERNNQDVNNIKKSMAKSLNFHAEEEEIITNFETEEQETENLVVDRFVENNVEQDCSELAIQEENANQFICNVCNLIAEDGTVECEGCSNWNHAKCENITKNDLKMIEKLHGKLKWFCKECNNKIHTYLSNKDINYNKEDKQNSFPYVSTSQSLKEKEEEIFSKLDDENIKAFKWQNKLMRNAFTNMADSFGQMIEGVKSDIITLDEEMNKLSGNEEKFNELRGELYSIKGEFNDMKYDNNKNHQENFDYISGRYEKYKNNRTEIRNSENPYDAKQRKENNLILYNMIESEGDNIDDKIKDDTSNLLDLLDYLQVSRI